MLNKRWITGLAQWPESTFQDLGVYHLHKVVHAGAEILHSSALEPEAFSVLKHAVQYGEHNRARDPAISPQGLGVPARAHPHRAMLSDIRTLSQKLALLCSAVRGLRRSGCCEVAIPGAAESFCSISETSRSAGVFRASIYPTVGRSPGSSLSSSRTGRR